MKRHRTYGPIVLIFLAAAVCRADVTKEIAEQNLAKIPATDPAAPDAPPLAKTVAGQHPRLLFNPADIAGLKAQIASDPILKKAYDDNAAWAKRFKLAKAYQPRNIVHDDTSAIVMVKSWPGLAYAYALDRDPAVRQSIIDILDMMLQEPYWANVPEFESSMGAGENLLMVGVLFDTVCNDLEPEFRAKVAANILTHARRMYYLGHQKLGLNPIKYWQGDLANNHRWHRDAGLAACVLSIADEPGLQTAYLLQQLKQEMDAVIHWYPADGDCHEGAGYQTFGFFYLALAADMTDRTLGTTYLRAPGFANAWAQQMYFAAPGQTADMSFGDDMNGPGVFDNQEAAFFLCPRLSRDADVQALYTQRFFAKAQFPKETGRAYSYPWALLKFYDPTVGRGAPNRIPPLRVFPDIGVASMRDRWADDAVCLTFKCGPYGGYKLNEYAWAHAGSGGKPAYVNVAHDDPDANEFALALAGDFIFHPGLYSLHKLTASHSTITVDGRGQINEGSDYTQPVPNADMRKMSYLTAWKPGPANRVIVEGEAAAAYPDRALQRFRRTIVWLPGEYVLQLDDVLADGPHQIVWRGTVEKGQFDKPEEGLCHAYTRRGKRVDFQMLADKPFDGAIDFAFLDGRFGSALMQQFQFSLQADAVKFACLLDPWQRNATMTMKTESGVTTITVSQHGVTDTWTWRPPADAKTPSSLIGKRGDETLIELTATDKAP